MSDARFQRFELFDLLVVTDEFLGDVHGKITQSVTQDEGLQALQETGLGKGVQLVRLPNLKKMRNNGLFMGLTYSITHIL